MMCYIFNDLEIEALRIFQYNCSSRLNYQTIMNDDRQATNKNVASAENGKTEK